MSITTNPYYKEYVNDKTEYSTRYAKDAKITDWFVATSDFKDRIYNDEYKYINDILERTYRRNGVTKIHLVVFCEYLRKLPRWCFF